MQGLTIKEAKADPDYDG